MIKFHCLWCYVHLCNAPICDHNILFVSIVGNLGIFRPELFVFPESGVSDNGNIIILILADISSHKLLLKVASCFYVCLAVLVGTGFRSTCSLMWCTYQEHLMHFKSLVSLIVCLHCLCIHVALYYSFMETVIS